ncbi:unnamed protein product, partial [Prorocentrum cordatum]
MAVEIELIDMGIDRGGLCDDQSSRVNEKPRGCRTTCEKRHADEAASRRPAWYVGEQWAGGGAADPKQRAAVPEARGEAAVALGAEQEEEEHSLLSPPAAAPPASSSPNRGSPASSSASPATSASGGPRSARAPASCALPQGGRACPGRPRGRATWPPRRSPPRGLAKPRPPEAREPGPRSSPRSSPRRTSARCPRSAGRASCASGGGSRGRPRAARPAGSRCSWRPSCTPRP